MSGALADIEITERHGVENDDGSFVDVRDAGTLVMFAITSGLSVQKVTVSPAKARYLARKLYRLARRAEARGR